MTDKESKPEEALEALTGSGGLRRGADMFMPPPKTPVEEPSPMPVNLAPAPTSSATPSSPSAENASSSG